VGGKTYGEITLKGTTVKDLKDFLRDYPDDLLVEAITRYFDMGRQEHFIFLHKKVNPK
jgi:hypothetical protein